MAEFVLISAQQDNVKEYLSADGPGKNRFFLAGRDAILKKILLALLRFCLGMYENTRKYKGKEGNIWISEDNWWEM